MNYRPRQGAKTFIGRARPTRKMLSVRDFGRCFAPLRRPAYLMLAGCQYSLGNRYLGERVALSGAWGASMEGKHQ
jgi:hypothetical protein